MKKISATKCFYGVAFSVYALGCGICAYGSDGGANPLGALLTITSLTAIIAYTYKYCK